MTDPFVLLVAGSAGDAAPLLDRLTALGFLCEFAAEPAASATADPVVILVIDRTDAPTSEPAFMARSRREIPAGVPVLRMGPEGTIGEEDELLAQGIDDDALSRRLRVWGRWSSLARAGQAARSAGGQAASPGAPTALPGHKAFMDRLAEEVKRHERYDAPLGLVLADIDGLREINSRYGHRTGDRVIGEVGETLREAVRASDRVFHYGGDTFAVLLTHATSEATRRAVSRLRSVFGSRIFRGDPEGTAPPPLLKISLSFGHVSLPEAGLHEPDELVAAAEQALAAARSGASGTTIPTGKS